MAGTGNTARTDLAPLVSLLDDPDQTVAPVIREHLVRMGPPIVGMLQSFRIQYHNNPRLLHRIDRVIADIRLKRAADALTEWRNSQDPQLMQGLCLLFALVRPDSLGGAISNSLCEMAYEVWVELSDAQTAVERIRLFNHIFYHRLRFAAEDPFLETPDPAMLDYAVAQRKANPILFGLLYLAVAFQAGIAVRAVAFPGGFLPVCIDEDEQILFYLNVYKLGEAFGREQLHAFLSTFGVSIPDKDFVLCDAVTLVGIYAESLYFVAGNTGNREMEYVLEEALKLFGDKRVLLIEEDDE